MWVRVRVEALSGLMGAQEDAESPGDELGGQRVEHERLLELQGLQLGFDLLKGDAVQAGVLVADGDEVLPELPALEGHGGEG